jgi:hypothetical protein
MSTEPIKVEEPALIVDEQKDGSVTVEGMDLPAEDAQEASSGDSAERRAEGGAVPEDGGVDHPDDTEAIRSARRDKRKAKKVYHRQQQQEKDVRFQQLQRQNQDLLARLSAVEVKTHGSELARIDKAIEDQQVRIQYAKMKIAEAAQGADGEGMANAQEMWFEARRAAEALQNLKKHAATPRQQAIAPDQDVQRQAASWMERNSWYDPSGGDEDSDIALIIDKRMAKEGWDPKSVDYWEELDSRLQKKLPHRYSDEYEEERPATRRPKSVIVGSGRENSSSSGGKNTFTLNPDQVRAMKDAGMWDDTEKRARMIRRYAQDARQNRNN